MTQVSQRKANNLVTDIAFVAENGGWGAGHAVEESTDMTTSDEASESLTDAQTRGPTAAPHPEEMKGAVEFRLGRFASVTATGRATPAGLVSAALLTAAVLLPLVWIMRRMRG